MAKLHDYHILCPLIDQKSFLGISEDLNKKHVIVTLGRNVVNRYRLSDQKQIHGWTSKDHITAPVIYDKNQNKYIGVFNNNIVKVWDKEETSLDKAKKSKFPNEIIKLIPRDRKPPLLIYKDGNCMSLPYAIGNRKPYKETLALKESDDIIDVAPCKVHNQDHLCYIVKGGCNYDIYYCSLRDEHGDLEKGKLVKEQISRDDAHVVGVLICTNNKTAVFVLWSDSKLTAYFIDTKSWRTVGTVPWISTETTVSMTSMGQDHLFIFGCNKEQDGAILIAYNYVLGVGSCRYPMKMYKEKAKIYCCSNRILLEASNHIGMLPFTLEIKRNLSSLLGSHEITNEDNPLIADWGTPTTPMYDYTPELSDTVKLGITERLACAKTVPDLLDKIETAKLIQIVQSFKDVPESVLTLLLSHAIKPIKKQEINVEIVNGEDSVKFHLLNEMFNITFCDALLIPHLRNSISVEDSLFLLKYIEHLLLESALCLNADYESRLYDWCAIILDAFYQQYIMSKDSTVHEVLERMKNSVSVLIKHMFTINQTMAEVNKMMAGNKNNCNEEYLSYAIEMMEL